MSKFSSRNFLVASLLSFGLICGVAGCSKEAPPSTDEDKSAFLGDASKMPESVKRQNAQMAQQNAQRAAQAQQNAQQQQVPKK